MIKLDLSVFIAFWPDLSTLVPPLSSRLTDSVSRPDALALEPILKFHQRKLEQLLLFGQIELFY